jgi:hypothetical protein
MWRRCQRERKITMRRLDAAVGLMFGAVVSVAALAADEAAYRFNAPITIERTAAFVQLPLPASAYGRSLQSGLHDLRIVDARGERVPFALLVPRVAEAQSVEQQRDAVLYPLPPRPSAGGVWASPVEIQVQGERISVKRTGRAPSGAVSARSGGWLFDLGERKRDDPPAQSLRVNWSGPAEFTTAFGFETSDDLRSWRSGGHGQLMALAAASGVLTQPLIALPPNAGRFVRLVWADAATAPVLTGAKVIASQQRNKVLDAPAELTFASSAEPAGKTAPDPAAARALHFDLGGALSLVQLDLRLGPGTRVVPARIQIRSRVDEPWREAAAAVFYRLERGGEAGASPPLALQTIARYVRIVPDARAAPFEASQTQLVVQAQLATVVFANQGSTPFVLLAGAKDAAPSALPIATLVPALDDERGRFGSATLGPWTEAAAVVRAEEAQQRMAMLRPWLLWLVLVAGVAGLAFMVWRLTRDRSTRQ